MCACAHLWMRVYLRSNGQVQRTGRGEHKVLSPYLLPSRVLPPLSLTAFTCRLPAGWQGCQVEFLTWLLAPLIPVQVLSGHCHQEGTCGPTGWAYHPRSEGDTLHEDQWVSQKHVLERARIGFGLGYGIWESSEKVGVCPGRGCRQSAGKVHVWASCYIVSTGRLDCSKGKEAAGVDVWSCAVTQGGVLGIWGGRGTGTLFLSALRQNLEGMCLVSLCCRLRGVGLGRVLCHILSNGRATCLAVSSRPPS